MSERPPKEVRTREWWARCAHIHGPRGVSIVVPPGASPKRLRKEGAEMAQHAHRPRTQGQRPPLGGAWGDCHPLCPGPPESVGEGPEWEPSTAVPMVPMHPGSQGGALTGSPLPAQCPRCHPLVTAAHRFPSAPQGLTALCHHLKMMFSRSNGYSMMPVVGTRTRSTSCWVGR